MSYSKEQIHAVVTLKKAGVTHREIAKQVFGKKSFASSVWYILNEHLYNAPKEKEGPRILLFDIETAPEIVYSWGRWKQNTGVSQVIQRSYMLCWSAKWLGSKEVLWDSIPMTHAKDGTIIDRFEYDPKDDYNIVRSIWLLLDSSDVVVAHNGIKFDIAYLNSRFAFHGLGMPSPFKVVDTLKVAKKYFRFPSNSLAELAEYLGVEQKKGNTDFSLWKGCMEGNVESWEEMIKYNVQDVEVLEGVYYKLRDYDKSHPNLGLYYDGDELRDPVTGSTDVVEDGYAYTAQSKFKAYKGVSGHSFRSSEKVKGVKSVNTQ